MGLRRQGHIHQGRATQYTSGGELLVPEEVVVGVPQGGGREVDAVLGCGRPEERRDRGHGGGRGGERWAHRWDERPSRGGWGVARAETGGGMVKQCGRPHRVLIE
jgi:hypothetical protein